MPQSYSQSARQKARDKPASDREVNQSHATLEADGSFRDYFEDSGLVPRLTLICVALLMVGVTPFYDRLLLGVPESFVDFSRWMQFGVQVPPLVLALWCTWNSQFRRWSASMTVFAMLMLALGLSSQHIVGKMHGFHVPHDFATIAICGVCLLARLRLSYLMPWATFAMLGTTAAQLYGFDFSSAAIYNTISLWMMFALSVLAAQTFENTAYDTWRQRLILESQAAHDALTGLPNRRHFDRTLVQLMRQAAREGKNIALMVMDVDHFKLYNDRYGHPAGDQCLRDVGEWMRQCLRRPNDFCARVGGEEFAAVWYDARSDIAPALAEQLRAGIADLGIEHLAAPETSVVTCSAGFIQVSAPHTEEAAVAAVADLYDQADRALYEAKRAGRNRMMQFGEPVAKRAGATLWPMI